MRLYSKQNVFDAALDRIRWLFDEFPNVVVGYSGGKDSTIVLNLALMVAKEKGRLPQKVLFLDQEAEWQATVDQVEMVMSNPDVEPVWIQVPFVLFNATSTTDQWLQCWDEDKKADWMRPKKDIAIKENIFNETRFSKMFGAIFRTLYPDTKSAYISGVRAEESPSRYMGLTHHRTYKWATWGKVLDKKLEHYTMYPIYDWSYTDVWKAICDNDWKYNSLYDAQYQYGIHARDMRVSNVHHETAVTNLFYMQEVEPETYARLTQRIGGIDTAGKMGTHDFFVRKLPHMFKDWFEYRDFLLEKLLPDEAIKAKFRRKFEHMSKYEPYFHEKVAKVQVQSILTNDWEFVKLDAYEKTGHAKDARKLMAIEEEKLAAGKLEKDDAGEKDEQ